jgi:hypothetical protein
LVERLEMEILKINKYDLDRLRSLAGDRNSKSKNREQDTTILHRIKQ